MPLTKSKQSTIVLSLRTLNVQKFVKNYFELFSLTTKAKLAPHYAINCENKNLKVSENNKKFFLRKTKNAQFQHIQKI
jgi:hypothetical protein